MAKDAAHDVRLPPAEDPRVERDGMLDDRRAREVEPTEDLREPREPSAANGQREQPAPT